MLNPICGILAVLGRMVLCAIFLGAVAKFIPDFKATAEFMDKNGVPQPQILLAGAIVFLIVGSVSVVLGYRARFGALLLLIFLVLAAYYFHAFWKLEEGVEKQNQMAHFMKNVSMAGAMLFIMGNGSGPMSLDRKRGV
jgi:putative oxidoreductase